MTGCSSRSTLAISLRALFCVLTFCQVDSPVYAQTLIARLHVPVELSDVNFEVERWRVSCEVFYPVDLPSAPPRREDSIFQPVREFFSWLGEIAGRLLGIGREPVTIRPPGVATGELVGSVTAPGTELGFDEALPDLTFSNSYSGQRRNLDVPVLFDARPFVDRRQVMYSCQLSFFVDDESESGNVWLDVLEGEPGYAHSDVRLRAREGSLLNTVATGNITSFSGQDTEPIVFMGAVLADDSQIDALDVFTRGVPLGGGPQPHPAALLQYVAFACEPPWETDENGIPLVDYHGDHEAAVAAYERVLSRCTTCHDPRTWVPGEGATYPVLSRKLRVIDNFVPTGEIEVEEASQEEIDGHPASIKVNCLQCHVPMAAQREAVASAPEGQVVAYRRVEETMQCENCHGHLLKPWTAQTLCGQTLYQPRLDHIPRGVWQVMELFDRYKLETGGCFGVDLPENPGSDTWCLDVPIP